MLHSRVHANLRNLVQARAALLQLIALQGQLQGSCSLRRT